MSAIAVNTFRRLLPTLIPAAVIVAAFIAVIYRSAEGREIAGEAAGLVFTFFTTPFVLETTVAMLGLILVLAINQRRLEKDKDEWVEMEVPTPLNEAEKKKPVD